MAYPPAHLVTNAAKTHLESRSTSPKHLYYQRPAGFWMAEDSGSFMAYDYYPSSGMSWADAHSAWAGIMPSAAWSASARPSHPVYNRNACRIVGYLNDPTQASYVGTFQQSVRMLFGNIISIKFVIPSEWRAYRDAITGFELSLKGGAAVTTTTFQASTNDYVYSSSTLEGSLGPLARILVSASRPSEPENVLQSTAFQPSIYSLQTSSDAQANVVQEGWRVSSGGYVFQNVTAFAYGSTAVTITPSSAVNATFAAAVAGSETGEVWISAAITEDYLYPIAMRTNLLIYLGEFEVYAKF